MDGGQVEIYCKKLFFQKNANQLFFNLRKTQMTALRYNIKAEYYYVDAPHVAIGPPDEGICTFYPNHDYFEW